jgi:hypothetical protein
MTTRLDKTLKRELTIGERAYVVALSPSGIKITLKGRRKGQELRWSDLVSGDAALAIALNASVGRFAQNPATAQMPRPSPPQRVPYPAKIPAPGKGLSPRRASRTAKPRKRRR